MTKSADSAGADVRDERIESSHDTRADRERGSASVFFLVTSTAVVAAIGLLVDGGQILAAKAQAIDEAQQAARAGAQQLDLRKLRTGEITPLHARVITAAEAFLHSQGESGTAIVDGDRITVTAKRGIPSRILVAFGIRSFEATGTGSATLVPGIAQPDDADSAITQGGHPAPQKKAQP